MKKIYLHKLISILLIIIVTLSILSIKSPNVQAANTYNQTLRTGIDAFPESYQVLLRKFVDETAHTNWNFQAYYTGIDWNEFIQAEAKHGMNRVHYSYDTIYRDSCNDLASGYYCADKAITSYFIDPRNFINQRNIFQFLEISYNKDLYTKSIVEEMIKSYKVFNYGEPITFVMSDENHPENGKTVTMTFADIIMDAAEKSQMSPISIVTKIIQEVGADGSGSVSGNIEGYQNCYNYFNLGAYDTGDAIENALKYANSQGWHCPYSSIVEGAEFNSKYYIQKGQNTLYFYKYDCVGNKILSAGEEVTITSNNLYHQYMTNISDPYSQSARYFSTYTNYNLLDKSLNFIIPVFDNMPSYVEKPSTLKNAENQDLYYANVTSSLSTRVGPGYENNYTHITLYKDDLVIMLERHVNGGNWDKVQFWDGTIGYVVSEYLEKYEKPSKEQIDTPSNTPIIGGTDTNQNTPKVDEVIIGYGYADVSSSLNVRQGPGSTYAVVTSLKAKEEFAILNETEEWYKIKTNNNIIGYVTKEYGKQIEYAKFEENIIKVIPTVTGNMIAKMLGTSEHTIKNGDTIIENDKIGTGYKVVIGNKEYTIIKLGDVNGDSDVDIIDLAILKRQLLGKIKLEGVYKTAGKLQQNEEEIDIIDLALMKRQLLGTALIKV